MIPASARRQPARLRRASWIMTSAIGALMALSAPSEGHLAPNAGPSAPGARNFDIRVFGGPGLGSIAQAYSLPSIGMTSAAGATRIQAMQEEIARLKASMPGLEVQLCGLTGAAEVVRNPRGALTAGAPGRAAADIALDFVRANAAAYGLAAAQVDRVQVIGESVSRASGLRTARFEQMVNGAPVFQSQTRATVDGAGRLVRTVGRLVPGVDDASVPSLSGLIPAGQALQAALASVGLTVEAASLSERSVLVEGRSFVEVDSTDPILTAPVRGHLVYFALAEGTLVPGWFQVILLRGGQGWATVVDGRAGVLLYRKNLRAEASTQPARFSVYARANEGPEDSPAPGVPNRVRPGSGTQFPSIARRVVAMHDVQDPIASPDGWIPDGGETTTGNNADAFLSRNGTTRPDLGTLDRDGRPVGNPDAAGRNRDFLGAAPRSFDYTPAPRGTDPDDGDDPSTPPSQRGVVTELFYLANYYHDRMYRLGFDEAAGNFQDDNFNRGGRGADALEVLAQEGVDIGFVETAWSYTAPDGFFSQIGMSLFPGPDPDRDSGLDAGTVLHELTHGLSGRLIGDGVGLNWDPGGGMGEGWSDFYALALLYDRPGDDPSLQVPLTPYAMYQAEFGILPPGAFTDNYIYGIRRFPYSTDNRVNPLSWADADPTTYDVSGGIAPAPFGWERFGAGEVHSLGEIWALSLWEVRSRIIAARGGDVAAGNQQTLQIVTDAMKLTPIDPSFIQARDAILDADCAAHACANEDSIWGGFADRGLGYGAGTSLPIALDVGVRESFQVPFLDAARVFIDDSAGDGDGFAEPGETVAMRVELVNPWRSASKGVPSATAVLSSQLKGVSISDRNSAYGAIPAQGSAVGDPFVFSVPGAVGCGQVLRFNLQVKSALGRTATVVAVRVGRPSGTGAPVTFTRAIPGGLPIPSGDFVGVTDTLSVGQDLEIADLDVRVDDLRHTWIGDLSIMLRGPGGFGTLVIWLTAECSMGFCFPGDNGGDDFVLTRIDDGAHRDLWTVGSRAAPFTGSWIPVLNSRRFFLGTDPAGQLAHHNGTSTLGDWKLHVVDFFPLDTGRLSSWSVIATPVAYSCGP